MFKWIKQLFEKEDEHGAYNVLPCAAMQSEIIANELVGEKLCFSEPVNPIVESLKEEGRWTWEHEQHASISSVYYLLVDTITGAEFKLMCMYDTLTDCKWASREENKHMASEMLKMITTKEKEREAEEKAKQRADLTVLYKKAANAE